MTDDEWGVDPVTGETIVYVGEIPTEYWVINNEDGRDVGVCVKYNKASAMRAIMAMGIRATARVQRV